MAREGISAGWQGGLERWLAPFLERLGHKARQQMCPLYVAGLIGPGDRKSIQPMAEQVGFEATVRSERPPSTSASRCRRKCGVLPEWTRLVADLVEVGAGDALSGTDAPILRPVLLGCQTWVPGQAPGCPTLVRFHADARDIPRYVLAHDCASEVESPSGKFGVTLSALGPAVGA